MMTNCFWHSSICKQPLIVLQEKKEGNTWKKRSTHRSSESMYRTEQQQMSYELTIRNQLVFTQQGEVLTPLLLIILMNELSKESNRNIRGTRIGLRQLEAVSIFQY